MSADNSGQVGPLSAYSLEDLTRVEEELQQLLQQKQSLSRNLENIENSLYNLETSYIEDSTYGNIIKGYDAFLNARTLQNRRQRPTEQERIFSRSSVNYTRNHDADSPPPAGMYAEDPSGDGDFVLEKSINNGNRRKKRNSESGSRLKKRIVYSDEEE